uniref:Uncharacterized protein n=1 Tax=Anguilla anguilla TaxID=7936 RepID=A0A0E9WWC9_ANGAN
MSFFFSSKKPFCFRTTGISLLFSTYRWLNCYTDIKALGRERGSEEEEEEEVAVRKRILISGVRKQRFVR